MSDHKMSHADIAYNLRLVLDGPFSDSPSVRDILLAAEAALVQQAQEGYRTEQLADVDFVVNASVSDVVELITSLRAEQAQPQCDECGKSHYAWQHAPIRSTDPHWGVEAIIKQRKNQ